MAVARSPTLFSPLTLKKVYENLMALPTHAEKRAPAVDDPETIVKSSSPAQYEEADRKLFRLEEELHFLIQCSRIVWNQRADFAESHLDSSGNVNVLEDEQDTYPIDGYLALVEKGRKLDDEIGKLKERCSTARNEFNFHFAFQNDSFEGSNYKGHTRSLRNWLRLNELDSYGGVEKEAAVEPILDTASRAINVAAAVGAVGASIAYSTLFSATRGRLDLIAWSFMCFIAAVSTCALMQGIQRSRRIMVKTLTSISVSILLKFIFTGLFIISILLMAGTALLAVSVALINRSANAVVVGSRTATSIAGYLALGWICLLMVLEWIMAKNREEPAVKDQPPSPPMTADERKRKNIKSPWPSHILSAESKWDYLPGEKGYSEYRQSRRSFIVLNPSEPRSMQNYSSSCTSMEATTRVPNRWGST